MSLLVKEIHERASRLNIDLDEKEFQKAQSYLIQLRNKRLSVSPESLSTHSIHLVLTDSCRGFPIKEAVLSLGTSLQQYVTDQRLVAIAFNRSVEFSFSTIAVFLGCTQLTEYCEKALEAYKEWFLNTQSKIAYQKMDWELFNFKLGVFMAVCDAVGFKVPADYRKQVTEALKDFLAGIKTDNKQKSSKKGRTGSALSKSRTKSLKNTPTNVQSNAILHENNTPSKPENTSMPMMNMLTSVDHSKKRPAWKVTPPKTTKKISTGLNFMAPVENLLDSEKHRKNSIDSDPNLHRSFSGAVDDFGQKYHCDNCSKDITHLLIIRCAICPDFDLCINCFAEGIELKDHKKTHDYRVIDVLDFPIFEADWGADEELLLVEGLEMFGLGNWETISEHIGTKNAVQVAEHYDRVYVKSDAWPYPNMEDKFDMTPAKRLRARHEGYVVPKLPKPARPPASQPVNHEIGGFMPGRKEFEHEYENDADQIVKDIEFTPEDSKEDTALKCAVLNNYNIILDRRAYRKSFLFERGFTDFKKIQAIEKKRPKEEKELYHKYRVFAKMQTASDFNEFMEGIIAESKLRNRIAQLQEYIRMGITSLKEAGDYEKQKVARANKTISLPQVDRTQVKRSMPIREDSPPIGSPHRSSLTLGLGTGGLTGTSAPTTRKTVIPLDISNAEGVDLLGESEQALCSSVRIFPRAYLSIKDIVLKEYALKGSINRKAIRSSIRIESTKILKLLDYFQEQGWVSFASSVI